MLRRIEPSKIICYSEPFSEMQGDIIYVDYELSGWKYLKYKYNNLPLEYKGATIVYKTMIQPDDILKGTGSAYGGKWKPKKKEDELLLGNPNTINIGYNKKGNKYEYLIGNNGKAIKVRHNTDHSNSKEHSNPHDHLINWDTPDGHPEFSNQINYFDGNIPELKFYIKDYDKMETKIFYLDDFENFKTQSEFKFCLMHGGEVQFIWKDKQYTTSRLRGKYFIAEAYKIDETGKWYDTPDDLLEYEVSGDKLRNVITKVEVIERTL